MLKSAATNGSRGQVLRGDHQREVEAAVEALGLARAAKRFGVSQGTLTRVVGGFGLAEGTITKIQDALDAQ